MKIFLTLLLVYIVSVTAAFADTVDAACAIYPAGSDKAKKIISCTFSQRQGYIYIRRADGVEHELSPSKNDGENMQDQKGNKVFRENGLGDQGFSKWNIIF